MPRNRKKSEDAHGRKNGKNLSEDEYKEKLAASYGLAPEDIVLDPETGIVWYKARFDPKTRELINPMRLRQPEGGFFCRDGKFDPNTGSPIDTNVLLRLDFMWKPQGKPAKIIGPPLRSLADLAALAWTWRKPRYKKLRHVYVDDGSIVDYEGATRRAQAIAFGLVGYTREGLEHIKDRIAEVRADSVFMVHNCPSADYAPPSIDRDLVALCLGIPELKAHVIIYPASFDLISVKGIFIVRVMPDIPGRRPGSRFSYMRFSRLRASPELAAWANALTGRRNYSVVSLCEKKAARVLDELRLSDINVWGTYIE